MLMLTKLMLMLMLMLNLSSFSSDTLMTLMILIEFRLHTCACGYFCFSTLQFCSVSGLVFVFVSGNGSRLTRRWPPWVLLLNMTSPPKAMCTSSPA